MLAVVMVALASLVATAGVRNARARASRTDAAALAGDTVITRDGVRRAGVRRVLARDGPVQTVPATELRRRVEALAAGTYVGDLLAGQDSALYRWSDRPGGVIRVYVQPSALIPRWSERYPALAIAALAEWRDAGFPMVFTMVPDSAAADIAIRWVERFPTEEGQRIGVTDRLQSTRYEIVRADLGIANHDSTGRALPDRVVAGILRHELGHALGLNHADDPTSVMYREAATTEIAESDRRTLRLVYAVPGGSLK